MNTYEFDKVLAEYANGRMTVEMAMGHSLQHIGKIYAAQVEAKASRLDHQNQINMLDRRVNTLQMAVDRLTTIIEKFRVKRKRSDPGQPKTEQP